VDLPEGARVTTGVLWRGTLLFAALDLGLLVLLWRLVSPPAFARLRRPLPVATAIAWAGIWLWAVTVFWDRVYGYVFPAWLRWYLPASQALLTALVSWIAVRLAPRLRRVPPVVAYCLLGGVWGVLTHIWAVFRGIVSKPPFLQGAHPAAAVTIAFFEFTFYWCVIVLVSYLAVFGVRPRHDMTGSVGTTEDR
jgi:hypothetical protein